MSSVNESEISLNANKLNEENYSSRYNLMVVKIKGDPDGESMDLPDYRYYYDIDSTSNCATINYGIQGTQGANGVGISNILQTKSSDGINTVTFVLTDGTSYDIYINDGATGSVGLTGPTGEQGEQGAAQGRDRDAEEPLPGARPVHPCRLVHRIVNGLEGGKVDEGGAAGPFPGHGQDNQGDDQVGGSLPRMGLEAQMGDDDVE